MKETSEITLILQDWKNGDETAQERLLPFVYDELKKQARILMARERIDHTLQPTALVHETFLKLCEQSGIEWQNRRHFFGITSRLMRQILVDHARAYAAEKRGGNTAHLLLDDVQRPIAERAGSILALDKVLRKLAELDEAQAQVVEMRFFGGLSNGEIAAALGVSERTVSRDWQTACLWLFRELRNAD